LQHGRQVTVQVIRRTANRLAAGPLCGDAPAATIAFTTATALATQAATEASTFTLAPNPARDRATLTLAAPLPQPTAMQVLDALGRPVRQQALPARATTAVLDLTGLPAGLYLVRGGGATGRLVVE